MAKKHDACKCKSDNGWLPVNSRIQVNDDKSINIQAPPGWEYLGVVKSNSRVTRVASGNTSVSCLCNVSGQCLPFTGTGPNGSTSGCAGGCTNCTMKQSAVLDGKDIDFIRGGYVDFTDSMRIIDDETELPAAFDEMFQLQEVENEIQDFFKRIYCGMPYPEMKIGDNYVSAPRGFTMTPVSIFGRAAMVPVPTALLSESLKSRALAAGGGGSKASCSCTDGSCTAKTYNVPFVGSATYCEGSCAGTCTLTTSVGVGAGVEVELYKAISYNF